MYNSQANDPLCKGVVCQHCGKSFRNRAGLSGHIQYKHGITSQKKGKKKVEFMLNMNDILEELVLWKAVLEPSEFEYNNVIDMFLWWPHVKLLVEGFGLELNEEDLHNYIITLLRAWRIYGRTHNYLGSLVLPLID